MEIVPLILNGLQTCQIHYTRLKIIIIIIIHYWCVNILDCSLWQISFVFIHLILRLNFVFIDLLFLKYEKTYIMVVKICFF